MCGIEGYTDYVYAEPKFVFKQNYLMRTIVNSQCPSRSSIVFVCAVRNIDPIFQMGDIIITAQYLFNI